MHSVRTRLDIFQAIRYMCIIHQVAKIRISIHSYMSQCDDLQVFEFITQHLLNGTEKKNATESVLFDIIRKRLVP